MQIKLISIAKMYKMQIMYLFFGVLTTVINILLYTILRLIGHIDISISYWVSWFFAVLFAYITNKIWVFESKNISFKLVVKEIISFYVARLLTGIIGNAILYFGSIILKQNDIIWNIIQNIFVIIANYVLSKLYIFKKGSEIK